MRALTTARAATEDADSKRSTDGGADAGEAFFRVTILGNMQSPDAIAPGFTQRSGSWQKFW